MCNGVNGMVFKFQKKHVINNCTQKKAIDSCSVYFALDMGNLFSDTFNVPEGRLVAWRYQGNRRWNSSQKDKKIFLSNVWHAWPTIRQEETSKILDDFVKQSDCGMNADRLRSYVVIQDIGTALVSKLGSIAHVIVLKWIESYDSKVSCFNIFFEEEKKIESRGKRKQKNIKQNDGEQKW